MDFHPDEQSVILSHCPVDVFILNAKFFGFSRCYVGPFGCLFHVANSLIAKVNENDNITTSFRFRLIKKPAHPGDKSPERLASNSPFHFPLRRTSCSPSLASDHARSRLDDGGGLLRADKYHTRKVCQDGIAAHDLSEGEFSSISGLTICSAVAFSDRSGSTELGTILKCG